MLLGADETEGAADGILVPLGLIDVDGLLLRSRLLGADETEGIADGTFVPLGLIDVDGMTDGTSEGCSTGALVKTMGACDGS